jgi:hypothetical protein
MLLIALSVGFAVVFAERFSFFACYEAPQLSHLIDFLAQVLLLLGIVATAAIFLLRSACPGAEISGLPALASFPIGAIVAFTAAGLALAHGLTLIGPIIDDSSLTCLFYIPLFAIVPFATVIWTLRTGAVTDLSRTGAAAGLAASPLGASACALSCANALYVVVALSHGVALEISPGLGAHLGPRLLRW